MFGAASPSRSFTGTTTDKKTQSPQAPTLNHEAHSRPRQRRQPGPRLPGELVLLPDELLELVLLYCAQQDPSSLAVAASAHSKLHQAAFTSETAAVLTAHSIKPVLHDQQKMDQFLEYLGKYGQHIESLDLTGTRSREEPGWIRFNAFLQQLPYDNMQNMRSLSCSNMRLQLLPGDGFHGVLGLGTALTQLQVNSCKVMEGMNDLAEALLGLPNLQHLGITQTYVGGTERRFPLPIVAIGTLQKLTHLVLAGDRVQDADGLRHLQGLTNLQHLKLTGLQAAIRASTLFPFEHLTHLEVNPSSNPDQATGFCSSGVFEPAALAGMTQLQHVQLTSSSIVGGPAGVAELLSHLQQHITQTKTLIVDGLVAPPKSCVTLTASTQLESVIINAKLSSQQVLGIAKQFPHLRAVEVDIRCSGRAAPLHTSSLVSCCPGLQALVTPGFHYSAEVVAQLSEMSSLTKLSLRPDSNAWDTVCQMTGLRHLRVSIPDGRKGEELQLLRQLTQLQQLTCLDFRGGDASCCLTSGPAGKRSMQQEVLLHISGREEAQRLQQLEQQRPKSSSGRAAVTHQQGPVGQGARKNPAAPRGRQADRLPAPQRLSGHKRAAVPGGDDGYEMDTAGP